MPVKHLRFTSSDLGGEMSIEVITINQRTVTYRVASMPGDDACLFHSLCYILHGPIRLNLDIRGNIMSYVLNDWDRFKVWTDDGTEDIYTTQEHYKSEMLKPFTYASACELMAAGELFGCRFQVYRNGQIFYTFGEPPMPLKHFRFTGDDLSSGHFDVYECFNSQKLDAKLSMKPVVCLQCLTDAECQFNTSPANTNVIETNHETQTDYDSSNPSCEKTVKRGLDPSLSEFPDDHQNRWERSPSDSLRHKASRKSRKKPKPSPSPRGDSRGCKVRTLHVRVRDLGLGYDSDEIVLFKYCAGSCQRARTNHDLTLSKLLQQKVIHSGRGEEKISAHPCCRPTRYEPVSFMDVQNTWQTVEKLSAAECSCVG
ncbi:ARTN protein, partial [Polypterus senegalus]